MILRKPIVLFVTLSALSAYATEGCQSGGVGDPCIPEDEYQPSFPGFNPNEVNVESRSFQCQTRVCLVNHFRGRVSCPLGQNETTVASIQSGSINHQAPDVCRLPGSSGPSAELVTSTVSPWCADRKADRAVYCSCRCDGPDPNANYCKCPSGYECKPFKDFDLGAAVAKGSGQLRGSYCVLQNSDFSPTTCAPAGGNSASTPNPCTAQPPNCGVATNP